MFVNKLGKRNADILLAAFSHVLCKNVMVNIAVEFWPWI